MKRHVADINKQATFECWNSCQQLLRTLRGSVRLDTVGLLLRGDPRELTVAEIRDMGLLVLSGWCNVNRCSLKPGDDKLRVISAACVKTVIIFTS